MFMYDHLFSITAIDIEKQNKKRTKNYSPKLIKNANLL